MDADERPQRDQGTVGSSAEGKACQERARPGRKQRTAWGSGTWASPRGLGSSDRSQPSKSQVAQGAKRAPAPLGQRSGPV